MGSYATRSRAWVYIAFYDEYVGKNINLAAGLSLIWILPMYWYGIHCNRVKELNSNMYYYAWRTVDKRNRLVHNMCMEHFEVHVEQLQDLILDMQKQGTAVFDNIPEEKQEPLRAVSIDELAMIDEMSGLTDFIDMYIQANNVPEHMASKLRSYVVRYTGEKSKDEVRYEMYNKIHGSR